MGIRGTSGVRLRMRRWDHSYLQAFRRPGALILTYGLDVLLTEPEAYVSLRFMYQRA